MFECSLCVSWYVMFSPSVYFVYVSVNALCMLQCSFCVSMYVVFTASPSVCYVYVPVYALCIFQCTSYKYYNVRYVYDPMYFLLVQLCFHKLQCTLRIRLCSSVRYVYVPVYITNTSVFQCTLCLGSSVRYV